MTATFCHECEKPMERVSVDFDYTRRAGLDPDHWVVILNNVEAYRCECGVAPRIPNLEGLHYTIGLALIRDPSPLDSSAVRFLRKALGMTQEQFAGEFGLTPQHYSTWERGKIPPKTTRIPAAITFLSLLLQRRDALENVDIGFISETLEKVRSRNSEHFQESARIEVACPPAWEIARMRGDQCNGVRAD